MQEILKVKAGCDVFNHTRTRYSFFSRAFVARCDHISGDVYTSLHPFPDQVSVRGRSLLWQVDLCTVTADSATHAHIHTQQRSELRSNEDRRLVVTVQAVSLTQAADATSTHAHAVMPLLLLHLCRQHMVGCRAPNRARAVRFNRSPWSSP